GVSSNAGDQTTKAPVVVTDLGVTKVGGPDGAAGTFVALHVLSQDLEDVLYNIGEGVLIPVEALYEDTQEPAYNASIQFGEHGVSIIDNSGYAYALLTSMDPGTHDIPITICYDKQSGITEGTRNITLSLTFSSLEVREASVSHTSSVVGDTVTFDGRVYYSHNGLPVAGATVALDGELKATADADGYFTFAHTENEAGAANHTITATADGNNRITFCSLSQVIEIEWTEFWTPVTMAIAIGAIAGVVVVILVVFKWIRKET
ncbi:MAG: hypothetical protein ACFFD6_04035, partial [Candidatus Thorarchaeota archaeon]